MKNCFFFYQQVNFFDNTVHVLEETKIVYYSVKLTNLREKLFICLLKCKKNSHKFLPKSPKLAMFW